MQPMNDFVLPVTRYALSGDVSIAFQVMGDGPIDIVLVPGAVSHVEFLHEMPGYTAYLRQLARFARVITFDKRGQGLSDRLIGAPSLEQRMDDVRAVMDEVGSQRAVLLGFSEGSAMSLLFAASYPERVRDIDSPVGDIEEFITGHRESAVSDLEGSRHGAVYRHCRFDAQCRGEGRSSLATIARWP
jgi:pimeloyl-ACP methyl ester carboxylesterase